MYEDLKTFDFFFSKSPLRQLKRIVGVLYVLRELEVVSRWAEGESYVTMAHVPSWVAQLIERLGRKGAVSVHLKSLLQGDSLKEIQRFRNRVHCLVSFFFFFFLLFFFLFFFLFSFFSRSPRLRNAWNGFYPMRSSLFVVPLFTHGMLRWLWRVLRSKV